MYPDVGLKVARQSPEDARGPVDAERRKLDVTARLIRVQDDPMLRYGGRPSLLVMRLLPCVDRVQEATPA